MDERLAGGHDEGARLVDGTVRRALRPWSPAVHDLLRHLEARGFPGAPRVLGVDRQGREELSHLPGTTVGLSRPWPAWPHSDAALDDVGRWLSRYHAAVADFVPAADARWREGATWRPGLVVGHGDAAPYNAVWDEGGLVGMIDWDMAGPMTRTEDLAWVAFSWTPLHERSLVAEEGFTAFGARRDRLRRLLDAYGWTGTDEELVGHVAIRLTRQIETIARLAAAGDRTYAAMLRHGVDRRLARARAGLADL